MSREVCVHGKQIHDDGTHRCEDCEREAKERREQEASMGNDVPVRVTTLQPLSNETEAFLSTAQGPWADALSEVVGRQEDLAEMVRQQQGTDLKETLLLLTEAIQSLTDILVKKGL
jgi:hypothetical protein